MSAPGNMTGEANGQGGARAVIGTLIGALGLLVIGYPVAPAAMRTMLLAWLMVEVGIAHLTFGRLFLKTGSPVMLRRVPILLTDRLTALPVAIDTQEQSRTGE